MNEPDMILCCGGHTRAQLTHYAHDFHSTLIFNCRKKKKNSRLLSSVVQQTFTVVLTRLVAILQFPLLQLLMRLEQARSSSIHAVTYTMELGSPVLACRP